MNVQEKTSRALDLWLLDVALTAVSFFLAYEIRVGIALGGHTLMPLRVYLPTLLIMVPLWAILLPLFGVYSRCTTPDLLWRLSKAIAVACLTTGAAVFIVDRMQLFAYYGSSRLILFFTFATNPLLLISYRLLLIRRHRYLAARSS